MIEETARVVETGDGFAWVETERKSSCQSCAANKGCGTAALSKVLGQRRTRVKVLNPLQAQPGEVVIIGIREDALVRGSLAVYALPLFAMLAGALAGEWLWASEIAAVLGGLVGFVVGLQWLRRFTARIAVDPRYQPVVLRRMTGGLAVT